MKYLLPGGGVSQVHGARSPVPHRLPHFATPRSVCHLATLFAGAYPLCRPPNAWLPGVPALLGLCYWLVATGTPMGWRGGCLAAGLVRGSVRHHCLGWCTALSVCARRSRLVKRAMPVPLLVAPPPLAVPPSCPSRRWWRVAPSGCSLFSPAGTPFHVVCAFRELRPVALLVRAACLLCVCVLALVGWSCSPSFRCLLARALCEVPSQDAGRAVLGGSCPSAFPARVPCSACHWWGGACGGVLESPFGFPGGVEGCPEFGTLPPLMVFPPGRRPGPAALVSSGAGIAGRGACHQTHSARSYGLTLRCAGSWRSPWGGTSCLPEGCPGLDTRPPPTVRPWGVRTGPAALFLWARGVRAWGPLTNATGHALESLLWAL